MNRILFLLVSCLVAGCSSGPVVQTDHDPEAAFGSYDSYAWRQPPPITNPLLKQRIVAAIDAELDRKGWRQVPEQDADVVLVGNVSARDEQTIDAFYDGPDWNGWGWRGGTNAGRDLRHVQVRTYKVGTLVLDMFDAQTKRAVWRATAEGTVPASQERINEDAMAAVHGMFADFPPSAGTAQ
jgi:hypothetical protein